MRMKGRQIILSVCCTWYMLYLVYAVLGVCYTQCMLYSVDAVLGVCCGLCQLMIMTWRDREGWQNFVFCDDSRVVNKKQRDGEWRLERCDYERIWAIRGTTCLNGLGGPRISVITRRIRICTCRIGDGTLPSTQNSLKSQFLMIIFPVPSHLSLSSPQFYHHIRTQS